MSMRSACSKRRITSSISVVVRPNFAASPPDFSQRPELFAHPENWVGAAFIAGCDIEDVIKFAEFLNHDHYALAAAGPGKGELDKLFVLETIEHQQAGRCLFQSHGCVQFCLRAGLQAKVVA